MLFAMMLDIMVKCSCCIVCVFVLAHVAGDAVNKTGLDLLCDISMVFILQIPFVRFRMFKSISCLTKWERSKRWKIGENQRDWCDTYTTIHRI